MIGKRFWNEKNIICKSYNEKNPKLYFFCGYNFQDICAGAGEVLKKCR